MSRQILSKCIEKVLNSLSSIGHHVVLKSEQRIAIGYLLLGRDVISILPTGFGKKLFFGELIHPYGCSTKESPNQEVLEEQKTTKHLGNIWQDAVKYSSCNEGEHCLFNNFDWVYMVEGSLVSGSSVGAHENNEFDGVQGSSANSSCSSSLIDYPVSVKDFEFDVLTFEIDHNGSVGAGEGCNVHGDVGEGGSPIGDGWGGGQDGGSSDGCQGGDGDPNLFGNPILDSSPSLSEKRKRNNQACRKFRKAKKTRHEQLCLTAEELQKENSILTDRIDKLEMEIKKWKEFFESHPKYLLQ